MGCAQLSCVSAKEVLNSSSIVIEEEIENSYLSRKNELKSEELRDYKKLNTGGKGNTINQDDKSLFSQISFLQDTMQKDFPVKFLTNDYSNRNINFNPYSPSDIQIKITKTEKYKGNKEGVYQKISVQEKSHIQIKNRNEQIKEEDEYREESKQEIELKNQPKMHSAQNESEMKNSIPRNKKVSRRNSAQTLFNPNYSQEEIQAKIFVNFKEENIYDNYTINEFLGEGSYGKVNVITHKNTGIIRCMKVILKSRIKKGDKIKILNEIVHLREMDHPNILKLHELYKDSKGYYLVTEHCSGGELFERINKLKSFSEMDVCIIMRQILSAICYMHNKSIIHRDIKPENILYENKKPEANLKIIDFGTACKFKTGTFLTEQIGTLYYLAPEVFRKKYNQKVDVWSAGIVMYFLLYGSPPFKGRNEKYIYNAIINKGLTFPDDITVSLQAKSMLELILDKNPETRLSSAEAVIHPWIKNNNVPMNHDISGKVFKALQNFKKRNRFSMAMLTFIVTQVLKSDDFPEIRKTFQSLDVDGDGIITREEMIEGFKNLNPNQEVETIVDRLMIEVDANSKGHVNYTQFVIAALNREKIITREKLVQAFRSFDKDNDGTISKTEIENMIGGEEIPYDMWKELIKGNDENDDDLVEIG